MLPVMFVREGKAAVAAGCNLGLVSVDKDPGVTVRTAAAIAGNNPVMRPSDRLLVNQFHSGFRLGLEAEVGLLEAGASHGL